MTWMKKDGSSGGRIGPLYIKASGGGGSYNSVYTKGWKMMLTIMAMYILLYI